MLLITFDIIVDINNQILTIVLSSWGCVDYWVYKSIQEVNVASIYWTIYMMSLIIITASIILNKNSVVERTISISRPIGL